MKFTPGKYFVFRNAGRFLLCLASLINITAASAKSPAQDRITADTVEANQYCKLAWDNLDRNPDTAIYLSKKAIELAIRHNAVRIEALAMKRLAYGFQKKALLDSAIYWTRKAMHLEKITGNELGLASAYSILGTFLKDAGKLNEAKEYLLKSVQVLERLHALPNLSTSYTNLGNLMLQLSETDSSIYFHTKALRLKEKLNDTKGLAGTYMNLANAYDQKGLHDTAIYLHGLCRKLYESNPDLSHKIPQVLNGLGIAYYHKKEFGRALSFLQQSAALNLEAEDDYELAINYLNLGDVFNDLNKFDSAKWYYLKSLELAQTVGATFIEKQILGNLTTSLETKIELQKSEVQRKTEQRNNLIIVIALISLLLIISVIFFQSRLRSRALLAAKTEELNRQQMLETLKQQEVSVMQALIEGQERERKRVAADLHDRVGSLLSTARLYFSGAEAATETVDTLPAIETATSLLDEACQEVRRIAHNIADGGITRFGLLHAIKTLGKTIEEASKMKVEVVGYGVDERLPYEVEAGLYRIVQELVANIIKHARATEISIQITRRREELNLIVSDNGRGFDTGKVSVASNGLGLGSVRSRAEALNGSLEIDSSPGNGTTVIVDIAL